MEKFDMSSLQISELVKKENGSPLNFWHEIKGSVMLRLWKIVGWVKKKKILLTQKRRLNDF